MKATDKEALIHEQLIKNYEKYYRIAYSYTFQEQDAMDIVQEAAYRAILKSESLRNPEYADTWICRIIKNEAVRFLERYKGRTVTMEELPEEGSEDQIEDLDLKQALTRLNNEERTIVVLKYFEEEKADNYRADYGSESKYRKKQTVPRGRKTKKIYGRRSRT